MQQHWSCPLTIEHPSFSHLSPTQPKGNRHGAPGVQHTSAFRQQNPSFPEHPQQDRFGRIEQFEQHKPQHRIKSSSFTASLSPILLKCMVAISSNNFKMCLFVRGNIIWEQIFIYGLFHISTAGVAKTETGFSCSTVECRNFDFSLRSQRKHLTRKRTGNYDGHFFFRVWKSYVEAHTPSKP